MRHTLQGRLFKECQLRERTEARHKWDAGDIVVINKELTLQSYIIICAAGHNGDIRIPGQFHPLPWFLDRRRENEQIVLAFGSRNIIPAANVKIRGRRSAES